MQEALMPELEKVCGNPECDRSLAARPGKTVRYCSVDCRSRARHLRAVERCKNLTEKICTACSKTKPIAQFTQPYQPFCQPCASDRRRASYRNTGGGKDRVYAKNLERNYGMTMEQYQEQVARQDGKCAICGVAPDHRLHVDHDHRTGAVRDLLCRPCNYALGNAQDSLRVVRAMVAYLERHALDDSERAAEQAAA